jgi:CRP/FNR family cyclic AMP-dependent transcriptional regulator
MALDPAPGPGHDSVVSPTTGALLSRTWFAADMPPAVSRRLAAIGAIADVETGMPVVQEGTPCRSLGVVVSGRIALRLAVPGVGDRTILTIDEGDLFGWSALLPGSLATSTGIALVPTRVVLFERDRMLAALASDDELAAAVYRRVLIAVVRRLHATRLQLLDVYRAGNEPW